VALLQQLTWAVNSLGHVLGSKVPGARGEGRDNLAFALLLFGEGLHSFHHRYPSAAVNEPARLDLHGALLVALERLGLVWRLRRYPAARAGPAAAAGAALHAAAGPHTLAAGIQRGDAGRCGSTAR
jgi:fatty-acid desaturase